NQYETSAGNGLSAVIPENPGWKRSRSASFFFRARSAAARVSAVTWTWRLLPSQSRYLVRATYRFWTVREVAIVPQVPMGVRGLATSRHPRFPGLVVW